MKSQGDHPKGLAQLFPRILAFLCPYKDCSRALSTSASLRRHIDSVHLGKKKFLCSVCTKRFTAKQNLKHHLYVLHCIHYREEGLRLTDMLQRAPTVSPREICPAHVHYVLPQIGRQQAAGPLPWVAERECPVYLSYILHYPLSVYAESTLS